MRKPLTEGLYRVSQKWGGNPTYYQARFGIPYHNGYDYAAAEGQVVHAIADGHVAWKGWDPAGYGHYIRIWHPQLQIHSFYAHLLDDEHLIKGPLDMVHMPNISEGDVVGSVGSTGNSTGPHLHFELRLGIGSHLYDVSPYEGVAKGRINPETLYAIFDRAEYVEDEGEVVEEESTDDD